MKAGNEGAQLISIWCRGMFCHVWMDTVSFQGPPFVGLLVIGVLWLESGTEALCNDCNVKKIGIASARLNLHGIVPGCGFLQQLEWNFSYLGSKRM